MEQKIKNMLWNLSIDFYSFSSSKTKQLTPPSTAHSNSSWTTMYISGAHRSVVSIFLAVVPTMQNVAIVPLVRPVPQPLVLRLLDSLRVFLPLRMCPFLTPRSHAPQHKPLSFVGISIFDSVPSLDPSMPQM